MAEALARRYAAERRQAVEARSAGVQAIPGNPAAPNAVRAIREVGGDLSEHQSQPVSDELVTWADRILVMELRHASDMRDQFPAADEKVQMLGTFGGLMELDDPYTGWIFRYRRSRDDIRRCVEGFMDTLAARPVR